MNEAYRLAAWLRANAKHMKYSEERTEMIKAARMLTSLEDDRIQSLEALLKAKKTLTELKGLIYELPKQEAPGDRPRLSLPAVRS